MAPFHGVNALKEPDTGHRSLKIVGANIILIGGEQMKITVTKIIFLALALILFPTATAAKGPDGVTPAEEYVCDDVTGKANGLCVAYCEAMDCDSSDRKASPKACEQTLANYMKLMDVEPPCYVPVNAAACPCFGRLTDEGFTDDTDCDGANDGLLKDTSNGSFLTVQAVADSINACMGTDGQIKMPIETDEANTCVKMIQDFCPES